jgi:hypothetical protein
MHILEMEATEYVSGGFALTSNAMDGDGFGEWLKEMFGDELHLFAEESKGKSAEEIKKGCERLAEKAWNECKDRFACRNVTDEKTVKSTVVQACLDAMNGK